MVDTPDLGSGAERRGGSSPLPRTGKKSLEKLAESANAGPNRKPRHALFTRYRNGPWLLSFHLGSHECDRSFERDDLALGRRLEAQAIRLLDPMVGRKVAVDLGREGHGVVAEVLHLPFFVYISPRSFGNTTSPPWGFASLCARRMSARREGIGTSRCDPDLVRPPYERRSVMIRRPRPRRPSEGRIPRPCARP
jgi:hypothetical protein